MTFSTENWEAYPVGDTGPWTPGTRGVADPDFFFDPAYPPADKTWTLSADLPDGRPGKAAFVPNRTSGDCDTLDETGAMMLDGPTIQIPELAQVPRLVVDHWLASEDLYAPDYYDGGNFKISVNGGPFEELASGALEFNGYDETLVTLGNTNPLAGQAAFTGTDPTSPPGNWGQTHINLLDIAPPGATIRMRLDFGVDGCDGVVDGGWYVDDLQYYYCSDELPPSDCGNALLDAGEQCDDGNDFIGDGCSNTCQIESGWVCTAPLPPGGIADPGFELGTPNPYWTEESQVYDFLICSADLETCPTTDGNGPADGTHWAWLGGAAETDESRLSQTIGIPAHSLTLQFDLALTFCDSASDDMNVLLDGTPIFAVDGSNPLCGTTGYSTQSADITGFADDGNHLLEFHARTFAENSNPTNFLIDNVRIPPVPSACRPTTTQLTLVKVVVNDNGGTALPSDWTLSASGPTAFEGSGPSVSSEIGLAAGTYDLAETGGVTGYMASAWSCDGGTQTDDDTVTLADDDTVTCTISNNDIPPILTLVKTVINDNGGSATPSDWTLNANGPSDFDGLGPTVSSDEEFMAGTYVLSETGGPENYVASDWTCDGGSQTGSATIMLAAGDVANCVIVNNDLSINPIIFSDGFEGN